MRRFFAVFLTFVLILTCLAGCRGEQKQNIDDVTFTDALGRQVTVEKGVKRVASLLGSFADVWVLAGGGLCAAPEDAWEDFGLTLDSAVNLGGAHSPSLELLVSAEPELVLASASTASNVQMQESLEAMGITVAYFDVDNFGDYLAMLSVCTQITGRDDLYEKNGLALKTQIDSIKASYASNHKVLILRAASGFVKAKGSTGTILGEMLYDLGCENIADRDTGLLENLSVEAVIEENPHHIFIVPMGSDTEAAQASIDKMIKENPAWNTLEAVREGRLHWLDKRLFNLKPNARWAESYRILYETLKEE